MIARYGTASSYQDDGEVRIVREVPPIATSVDNFSFRQASFTDDVLVSFKTYFARPRMFRFDWRGAQIPGSRDAVIWYDGKKVFSWTPTLFERDGSFTLHSTRSLPFSIDEAKGSSSGAVFFVPSLLMKELSYSSFADTLSAMTELSLRTDEQVDGHSCFVIKGNIYGTPWTLWVDKQERLLRKTMTLYSSGHSFHDEAKNRERETVIAEEIHRNIKLNERIPAELFKYKPKLLTGDVDLTH